MSAKVRIKAGSIEFEYEGDTELSLSDIASLFTRIEALYTPSGSEEEAPISSVETEQITGASTSKNNLHVNTIARRLNAKTGPDVALAAAAALQIVEGKETFTRAQLLEMMKKANMHYTNSMSGNLTKTIKRLVGSKFNQNGNDKYSLSDEAHQELSKKLA